jgi:hypothetical protein
MVDEREYRLRDLGVSPGVIALAMQRFPADLFEGGVCGRVDNYYDCPPRRRAMDLLPAEVVPLWASPYGFHDEVVGCRRSAGGLEYVGLELHTKGGDPEARAVSQAREYARRSLGDTDPVAPYLIARTDQGLLFWLFSDILHDFNWEESAEDKHYLRAAAEAVGFRHFDSVWDVFWATVNDPDYPKVGMPFFERYEVDLLRRTRELAQANVAATGPAAATEQRR